MGWVVVALLLCLVLAVLTYLKQSQSVSAGEERRRPQEAVMRGPGGRRGGARMRRPVEREDSEGEEGQEEREELEEAGIKVPDGKICKEKLNRRKERKTGRREKRWTRRISRRGRKKSRKKKKLKRKKEKLWRRRKGENRRSMRS